LRVAINSLGPDRLDKRRIGRPILHLFAALAENERAMIATRTKAALAAKERGVTLGNPKLSKARKSAVASIKASADQNAANVLPAIREIWRAGPTSLHQIVDALKRAGGITARRVAAGGTRRWSETCYKGLREWKLCSRCGTGLCVLSLGIPKA
jgi:DNA invertase Pin-like site-specific DNA recombinase